MLLSNLSRKSFLVAWLLLDCTSVRFSELDFELLELLLENDDELTDMLSFIIWSKRVSICKEVGWNFLNIKILFKFNDDAH